MISIPSDYAAACSLKDKILYTLSLLHKASAEEVAMEIAELQGIASEDGLSDLVADTKEEMEKLMVDGVVVRIKEHRQKLRYALKQEGLK